MMITGITVAQTNCFLWYLMNMVLEHFSLKCSQSCGCTRAVRGNRLRQGQVKCLFWSAKLYFFSSSSLKMEDKVQSLLQEGFSAICTSEKSHCGFSVSDEDFCCSKWKCRTSKFSVCLTTIASFWYLDSETRLIFALKIANFVSEVEIVREKRDLPKAEFWFSFWQAASR